MHYRHTQPGWVILGAVGIGLLLAVATVPPGAGRPGLALMGCVLAAVALAFGALTVEVDGESIRLRFGVGLVRKRIELADVLAWRAVRNPWYSGWGIRLGPRGVLWNVSGFDAVELDLPGGRRFRVGTDEPAELVAAISRARGVAVSPPPSTAPGGPGAAVRWLPLLAVLGLLAAVLVPLFWFQMRPPAVSVSPEGFRVSTPFYGARFAASEIEALSLEPRLPRVLARTNGFAAGSSLRGHFRLEGLGQGRLYVEQGHAPYLLVRVRDGFVFVSFPEPERTRALYEEMARTWPERVATGAP